MRVLSNPQPAALYVKSLNSYKNDKPIDFFESRARRFTFGRWRRPLNSKFWLPWCLAIHFAVLMNKRIDQKDCPYLRMNFSVWNRNSWDANSVLILKLKSTADGQFIHGIRPSHDSEALPLGVLTAWYCVRWEKLSGCQSQIKICNMAVCSRKSLGYGGTFKFMPNPEDIPCITPAFEVHCDCSVTSALTAKLGSYS